jgi:hypothetical protein
MAARAAGGIFLTEAEKLLELIQCQQRREQAVISGPVFGARRMMEVFPKRFILARRGKVEHAGLGRGGVQSGEHLLLRTRGSFLVIEPDDDRQVIPRS